MADGLKARWLIKRTGNDTSAGLAHWFPEKVSAAFAAKAAPRPTGTSKPSKATTLGDHDVRFFRFRVRAVRAMQALADLAVAIYDISERTTHFIAHGPAQAAALVTVW